ncbi:hypothetical protein [Streptomyces nitrosporeus]|uniref:LPXTG cell wall anchor domain-containing protein n=1 Tax=Streptomyces nitrosporeus TaxID=28894 RepID=A0A5J6F8A3_9ACTN|nr:hypothetical protein [Streptomyces nitrosporeus]QEU72649.1 hypothetical protein CP967_12175 [Streptomyces nitrosporeus]GGY76225.1 hypothetical protein GCM10010327_02650 [Streptomyces nitrosporeus]
MSIARRTLLTATAAGTLLCALWFVPSANATGGSTAPAGAAASAGQDPRADAAEESGTGERLADTGTGVDTTPYLAGGTLSLCLGAGFVAYSVRRGQAVNPGV